MKGIEINLAIETDRDWAAELMARSQPWVRLRVPREQCLKACHDASYEVYLGRQGQEAIAFMILHHHGVAGAPYIKSICVEEKFRNWKVGEKMIRFAEELFRPASPHLFLCVSSFNKKAQSFYHRLGFQHTKPPCG